MIDLSQIPKTERFSKYYNGAYCPYCTKESVHIDSSVVHQESYGNIYYCADCQAWVGTHFGQDQSLGTLAKKTLRTLRHEVHKLFDVMCEFKHQLGFSRKASKQKGYAWIAELLQIDTDESHIGFFNEEQCKSVIAECKKYFNGTPENKTHKESTVNHFEPILEQLLPVFISKDLHTEQKTMSIITIKKDNQVLNLDLKNSKGIWLDKPEKKWFPIKNIESFINQKF